MSDTNTITYTNPNGDTITGTVTGNYGDDYLIVNVTDDKGNVEEVLVSK